MIYYLSKEEILHLLHIFKYSITEYGQCLCVENKQKGEIFFIKNRHYYSALYFKLILHINKDKLHIASPDIVWKQFKILTNTNRKINNNKSKKQ